MQLRLFWNRRSVRLAVGAGLAVAVLASAALIAVAIRADRKFEAPYPTVHASSDPAVIARGRYLVRGPAHCTDCHGAPNGAGSDVALSGGRVFHLPFGDVPVPNLTADDETGLDRRSDGEIARVLRHGVHADGRQVLPFMPFRDLADDDLTAVLSYLRTLPPVRNAVPPRRINVIGRALEAFVLRPLAPLTTPPRSVTPAPTAEYGRYLAHSVANCVGCHTPRDAMGRAVGPELSGGRIIESHTLPGARFAPPNLTPDEATGRIANWTEELFVARLGSGGGPAGSPMPWAAFARMTEDDRRALYRYLRTLPAVRHDTGEAVRAMPVATASTTNAQGGS
jgi:mono/diheme cytochrome c family protein